MLFHRLLILSIFNVLWSEIKENYTLCVGRAYAIRQDNFGAADVCYAHKIKSTITSGLSLPFALLIAVFSPTFFGPPVICCSLSVAQFGQTSDQVKKRQKNRCLTSKHSNSALYTLIRLHKNFSIVFLSADSFGSALLVVSSKEGGRRGRTFWQVFCSIRFSAQARHLGFESGCMPWSKYLDPELSWGWILGMNSGDEVWGWTFVGRI